MLASDPVALGWHDTNTPIDANDRVTGVVDGHAIRLDNPSGVLRRGAVER